MASYDRRSTINYRTNIDTDRAGFDLPINIKHRIPFDRTQMVSADQSDRDLHFFVINLSRLGVNLNVPGQEEFKPRQKVTTEPNFNSFPL